MQPIRQMIEDAPDSIAIPAQFRHRRIELTIRPLGDEVDQPAESRPSPSFYDLTKEFCGCIEGGPPDVSANPTKYLEGFGK